MRGGIIPTTHRVRQHDAAENVIVLCRFFMAFFIPECDESGTGVLFCV